MSRELVEFPSYCSGSVKAQAPQVEVDKMLEKGTLEVVDPLGPGYYSQMFLVQKATGGWRSVNRSFDFQLLCDPHPLQDGD